MAGPSTSSMADDRSATEYLANERTFLAWVRTSIAIISLGFVLAKFDVWLSQLAARLEPGVQSQAAVASMPIGLAVVGLGGMLAILAAWHYQIVNRQIASGIVVPAHRLVVLITVLVGVLCASVIAHTLFTLKH